MVVGGGLEVGEGRDTVRFASKVGWRLPTAWLGCSITEISQKDSTSAIIVTIHRAFAGSICSWERTMTT